MAGFTILAIIFIVTQLVGMSVGYRYGFAGKQSKEAYAATHGAAEYDSYWAPVQRRMNIANLRLHTLFPGEEWKGADVVTGRRLVLGNADVRISYVVAGVPSPLYRNGVGDECVYVESGTARVETVFGAIDVGQGDYVVLPRSTAHRWVPHRPGAAALLRRRGQLPHHPRPGATCPSSGRRIQKDRLDDQRDDQARQAVG